MANFVLPVEERTVPRVLQRTVERVPDREFIRCFGERLTFAGFDAEVNRFARFLVALGLGRGDKLAIMLPNSVEFLYAWFASAKIGAIYVPINTEYRGDILRYQLDRADVSHIVIDGSYFDRLVTVAKDLPKLKRVVVRESAGAGESDMTPPAHWMSAVALDGFRSFDADPITSPVTYTDHHSICFTSGTTGPSKGVLSTHCHVVSFSMDWIELTRYTEDDVVYTPLPLFHAIAAWLGVLPTVFTGARMTMVERFSATRFWGEVRESGATVAHGIFSMVPILLKQEPRDDDHDNPARVFYIGQQDATFEARFGCRIVNAYGSTETSAVTYIPYDEVAPYGSCGRPNVAKYDVRIVDDLDHEVGVGEVGEVVVRPKEPWMMMDGYYGDPVATAAAFRNLWYHTGDNARRDEAGWYFFVDRKKDAIRRRGENISSYELECAVNAHPDVFESAAIAVPSDLGEDDVKVFVVRRPGTNLDHDALWAHCEAHMPGFWVPRYIEFVDALPRTPNQKITKYQLRDGSICGDVMDRAERSGERRRTGS